MKAIVATAYGGPEVLKARELPTPTPRRGEILIKVKASSLTLGDCELREMKPVSIFWLFVRLLIGVTKPRKGVFGQEFSGVIESVSPDSSPWKVGDEVFGATDASFGAHAEYMCISEKTCFVEKPQNISYAEAATLPCGALNALPLLRSVDLRSKESLLIVGAGGSIGNAAIQIAKHLGSHVTGVDQAHKLATMQSLGADKVIDYESEDYFHSGHTYDVIFDVAGKNPFRSFLPLLNEHGRLILANPTGSSLLYSLVSNLFRSKKIKPVLADYKRADLLEIKDLIESGTLRSHIDRSVRLVEAEMIEGHRYVSSGKKVGSVAVVMD
jgi:NADPH:quinone reductase-like Zn-dependent oxidoreductase